VTARLSRALVVLLAAIAAVLAFGVGTASAHVTVSSGDAAPGGFGELTFRVPTESDTASTISLRVQLPTDTPLSFVSVKPVPGWTAETTTTPLDPPVEVEGSQVTEAITEITWTAASGGGIKPGEYQSFSISAGPLPDAESLVLPAIQGYDDGAEVAWIDPSVEGEAEPEHPAPVLSLAAGTSSSDGGAETSTASSSESTADADDSGTSGVAVTALVLAIVGVLAALAALGLALTARRRNTTV
jgi:periplasmic copper chaperone A